MDSTAAQNGWYNPSINGVAIDVPPGANSNCLGSFLSCIGRATKAFFIYLLIILFPVEPSFLIKDLNDWWIGTWSGHGKLILIYDRVGEYTDLGLNLYAGYLTIIVYYR
jgi:hypothetical protein